MIAAKEESRNLLNKRNDLLAKAAKIKVEVEEAAKQRNAINEEVQNLKRRIDDIAKAELNIKSKIEEKKKELEEAKSKLTGKEEYLNRKIKDLEWRLITGGVSADEESEIVSSIAELHHKLAAYERVKKIDEELRKLKKEASDIKRELIKLLEEKK
ncbi:MAG: hypothetical protein QXH91_09470, partial [Candidatus Bathyarchaeia archaeon]